MSKVVVSVAILAATLVSQMIVGCGDQTPEQREPAPATVDAKAAASQGSWHRIREPVPRAPGFQGLVAVLVGDTTVVLLGVDSDLTDVRAMRIDLVSGRGSMTAPARLWWRFGYTAIAAGDQVIAWGGCRAPGGRGSRARGAIYDVGHDRWARPSRGPLKSRFYHTAVWTGDEMIVWGGAAGCGARRQPLADGAAYDPHTDSWRTIARSPLSPRQYHVAVWTGEEMIVWGGSKPLARERERLRVDGAAYDPKSDEWRRLAAPRLFRNWRGTLAAGYEPDLDAEWTGHEMTIWSRSGAVRYDPERDRWRRIPPPPRDVREVAGGQTAWSGEELIAWGGAGGDGKDVQEGAAYDPSTGQWRPLPAAPIRGRDRHAAASIPNGMLVWGGCCRGSRYYMNGAIYHRDPANAPG